MRSRLQRRRREVLPPTRTARGFSMLEMSVVVAMLGVIAALAVPNLMPVVHRARQGAAAEEVIQLLERARRLAYNEGRCHRVRLAGRDLVIERRTHANCVDIDDTDWEGPLARLRPSSPRLTFLVESSAAEPTSSIVFRPSGRLRGDGDLSISDDGARVLLLYAPMAPREAAVLVTAAGRVCAAAWPGGAPPLEVPVTCGTGFVGVTGGTRGGGCAAMGPSGAGAPALAALLAVGLARRRARRRATRLGRGYLLLEVMVSAGILAVILAGVVSIVATARRDVSYASRKAVASSLARAKAHELLGATHTPLSVQADVPEPGFRRRWEVKNPNLRAKSTPPLREDDSLLEVVVEIDYPTHEGHRTLEYRVLKRKAGS